MTSAGKGAPYLSCEPIRAVWVDLKETGANQRVSDGGLKAYSDRQYKKMLKCKKKKYCLSEYAYIRGHWRAPTISLI